MSQPNESHYRISHLWRPNILYVGDDINVQKKILRAFDEKSYYLTTVNLDVAKNYLEKFRIDVLFLDELSFFERFRPREAHDLLYALYQKSVQETPKSITMILFRENSSFIQEFKRKSETVMMLNRDYVHDRALSYLMQILGRQSFRTLVVSEFKTGTDYPVDLYYYMPKNKTYVPFLPKGVEFTQERMQRLQNSQVRHLYTSSEDLFTLLDKKSHFRYSEMLHTLRKDYKYFLSLLFDHSTNNKIHFGKEIYNKGENIIRQIDRVIDEFGLEKAFELFPMSRFTPLAHGLNTAIYTLIISRHCHYPNRLEMAFAALVHDIGEVFLELEPTFKVTEAQSRVNELEHRKHVKFTERLIRKKSIPISDKIFTMIDQHHENYDGTGYPEGVSGKMILKESSLLSICNVFDYIRSTSPGEKDKTVYETWNEVLKVHKESPLGRRFHPELLKEIRPLFEKMAR